MKKLLGIMLLLIITFFAYPMVALAQDGSMSDLGFFTQIFDLIKQFGGMSFQLKLSAIVALIIGSMKVSFLKPVWDKLGAYKALAAPILSLIAGIIMLPSLSLQGVLAYMLAGTGALILAELFNVISGLPGIGAGVKAFIEFISKILFKPKA